MLMVRILAYCDGSNFVGFGSGAGVYIEWDLRGQKMAPWKQFVVPLHPTNTNNEAEYHAVIAALEAFSDLVASQKSLGKGAWLQADNTKFVIYSDSQLVIRQVNGAYKTRKREMKALKLQVDRLRLELKEYDISFIHLPREQNEKADKLARIGSLFSQADNPTHSNG